MPAAGKDATQLSSAATIGLHPALCARPAPRSASALRALAMLLVGAALLLAGTSRAAAEIDLPQPDPNAPIVVSALRASRWQQGAYDVWVLDGRAIVQQGTTRTRGDQAVLWIKRDKSAEGPANSVIAYFEGDVTVDSAATPREKPPEMRPQAGLRAPYWLGEFHSTAPLEMRMPEPEGEPEPKPPVYLNGMARRQPNLNNVVRRAKFAQAQQPVVTHAQQPAAPTEEAAAEGISVPVGTRRIRILPRTAVPPRARWFASEIPGESIGVVTQGVNVIVDGVDQVGSVDILADSVVIWTASLDQMDLSSEALQANQVPLEIYMEGNIEFRQGDRVIYAERMYYDVRNQTGVVLNAEILTPIPSYQGLLRLKSAIVRQIGPGRFITEDTYVTSSRLADPRYRLQAGTVYFEDQERPVVDAFGAPVLDPETGEQEIAHERLATSRNNLVYLGNVPVFYWPVFSSNLEDPTLYLRRAQVRNDKVFGTQVLTDWDAYQLLGFQNAPEGTDWTFSADYLSERGPALGSLFTYDRPSFLGLGGPAHGISDSWAIYDDGLDNLGRDRRDLEPEHKFRYRSLAKHRQQIFGDWQLSGQLGLLSDRNFEEQYFEPEWDQNGEYTTGIDLKRLRNNRSLNLIIDARVNDFLTQTQWLPRADHFWFGQPLFGDTITWFEHSQAAFASMRTADPPPPGQLFTLFPWEAEVEGGRFATRNELDLPLAAGPVKVVPYVMGELAHWGADLDDDPITRAYGQTGVRASLPFWSVDPLVESPLLNVHGLAHKVVLDAEFMYAETNRDLDELVFYDLLDTDAINQFRRRFTFNTFGGVVPPQFDPRLYGVRTGLQDWVSAPSLETVADLMLFRTGLRQRWQTKRGLPGQRRIMDWVVFDTEATFYPDPDRDNFGEPVGLVNYDFRWHVGDRLTLLSDGIFDFFDDGQKLVSVGGFLARPPRGSLYLGWRSLQGPIASEVVAGAYSYRLSPKWISTAGAQIEVSGNANTTEQLALTRVGESLLISIGVAGNASTDNFGIGLQIEPRFLPSSRLTDSGGVIIPVAGFYGLE